MLRNGDPKRCYICKTNFKSESKLLKHYGNIHPKEKQFYCYTCNTGFWSQVLLFQHKKSHKNEEKLLENSSLEQKTPKKAEDKSDEDRAKHQSKSSTRPKISPRKKHKPRRDQNDGPSTSTEHKAEHKTPKKAADKSDEDRTEHQSKSSSRPKISPRKKHKARRDQNDGPSTSTEQKASPKNEDTPTEDTCRQDVSTPSTEVNGAQAQEESEEDLEETTDLDDFIYKCTICDWPEEFTMLATLADHTRVHSMYRPLPCPFEKCNYRFWTRRELETHQTELH